MQTDSRDLAKWGRAFLFGGAALGVLVVAALFTKGFGLFDRKNGSEGETPLLIRQGDKTIVPEGSPLRQRLTVAPAAVQVASGKIALPGIVESNPAQTAAVLTPLAGRVVRLKVALGDRVEHGQELAVIDSPDLAQALDDDEKAVDALHLTERNLARQEGQSKIGAASERDVDQARSDHAQASAEYTRTQARLRAIGVPDDGKERSRLLSIRAPIAGSITNLAVAPGDVINDVTQPLMTIADLSTVWVTALAPEDAIDAVAKGQGAEVELAAYPGKTLRGKVLFVSDVVDADSRRTRVRIAFSNEGYALKPNMFATVTLALPQRPHVVLPTSALLMNNDRTSVFVATAPWTFERRSVEAQLEEGSMVAIGSGVKAGEQVVIKGGILLND